MPAVIEFNCPRCEKAIRTNARYAGMEGPCPHCGKTIKVEASTDQTFEPVMSQEAIASASTECNTLLAGLAACGITFLLYCVFFSVRNTYVGELFTARGPIPFVITFVTCWGLTILTLKYLAVKQQLAYAEHEMDFIPLEKGMQIQEDNVDSFLQHMDGLPTKARASILGRRIRGALEHFRSRQSVPEVQTYLASHAEIDASTVDAGYTLLRAFIWAIPILGFIGTVMGISCAVSGLAGSLDTASVQATPQEVPGEPTSDPSDSETSNESLGTQMIGAMGLVTQGLATAFDTTFLALVMAILLLFPTESLKRVEYSMLDRITTFGNETLLRRLSDRGETLSPEVARVLEPAFRRHQQWLLEWQNQVAQLGQVIGQDFERHVRQARDQIAQLGDGRVDDAKAALESLARAFDKANDYLSEFGRATERFSENTQVSVRSAQELHNQLSENTEQVAALVREMSDLAAPARYDGTELGLAADALNQAAKQLSELGADGSDNRAKGGRGFLGFFQKA
jgi:biopolymer transport protein ExbB/TolQ/endogenous inhibitor of DNA gyrase (YacG/DUF329 family)